MTLQTLFGPTPTDMLPASPIRVVVAAFPEMAQPFAAALGPGNPSGVEVLSITRDTLDLLPDVKEYKPQLVLLSPEIRNYSPDTVRQLVDFPDFPVAVVGLVPSAGMWGSEMANNGAIAFYNTPITPAVVEQFTREAPAIVERARAAWRAPAVASGVSRNVLNAVGATAYRTGVVAFWSTKGGVGKTTLSTETACILSQVGGKRVLLVDANMNGGHVGLHLSLDANKNNLMHLASDYRINHNTLTADMLRARVIQADAYLDGRTKVIESRLHVLLGIPTVQHSGSKELKAEQGEQFMADLMRLAREQYEFVIVDLGSSIMSGVHMGVLASADLVMFISSADRTSIYDNRNVFQMLMEKRSLRADKFKFVINDFRPEGGLELDEIARYMGMLVYASVPHDASHSVLRCVNQGKPFSLAHLDIRHNQPEVEATLRGLFAIAEGVFPPLGQIIQARDDGLEGKGRGLFGLFKSGQRDLRSGYARR